MSILVHPDKNVDDMERAQKAFEAVNKAYKTLNNEEGFKRCQEIVDEAKNKTDELVSLPLLLVKMCSLVLHHNVRFRDIT